MFALLILALQVGPPPGPSPEMLEVNRAHILVGQNRAAEAIPILTRLIERNPALERAYVALCSAFEHIRDLPALERYLNARLRAPGPKWAVHAGFMDLYEQLDKPMERHRHAEICVQLNPDAAPCLMTLAALSPKPGDVQVWRSAEEFTAKYGRMDGSPARKLALAGALHITGRWCEAVDTLEGVAEQAEQRGDLLLASQIALQRAYSARFGCPERTPPYGEAALRLARQVGDGLLQNKALVELFQASLATNRFEEAAAIVRRHHELARETQNPREEVEALLQEAELKEAQGDMAGAIAQYKQVVPLARTYAYRPIWAQRALCDALRKTGDLNGAYACFARLATYATNPQDTWDEAYSWRRRSTIDAMRGNYFEAIEAGRKAAALFRAIGRSHNVGADVGNIGDVYAALGDERNAQACFLESLASARSHFDPYETYSNLTRLGILAMQRGRLAEAQSYLSQTTAWERASTPPHFRSEAALLYGDVLMARGRFRPAAEQYETAVKLAHANRSAREEANAIVALAECRLHMGELEAAEQRFESSLKLAQVGGMIAVIARGERGKAEILRRRGDLHAALDHLRRAMTDIESMRSRVPDPNLRASLVAQNARPYDDTLDLMAEVRQREPNRGWEAESLAVAERGRARSFLDTLNESRARVTKGLTPTQWQQLTQLEDKLAKQPSADTERALSEFVTRLHSSNPAYQDLRYPEPVGATEAKALAARMGTTIIAYKLGDARSYVWTVRKDAVELHLLPPRSVIEQAVRQYRELISRRPRAQDIAAYDTLSKKLYGMLVAPAGTWSGGLTIVPDGILHYLPFETLRGSQRLMIEETAISYAPSISVLDRLSRQPSEGPKGELVAWGDPDFGAQATGSAGQIERGVYQARGANFAPLPSTRREVEKIGHMFGASAKLYLGKEATKESVAKETLTRYRRIHFATHAVLDEEYPANSGVALSDGVLRMSEIFNLNIGANVVVLSACQTGLGKMVRGEGVIGLSRALFYAGTPRVVMSLWAVNDAATAALMEAFYGSMRDGTGVAAALRQAKLAMLQSSVSAYRHPYYWAPFVLEGAR